MKNIIKKKITKGFLLFLFTFFSVGVQAQWDEYGGGGGSYGPYGYVEPYNDGFISSYQMAGPYDIYGVNIYGVTRVSTCSYDDSKYYYYLGSDGQLLNELSPITFGYSYSYSTSGSNSSGYGTSSGSNTSSSSTATSGGSGGGGSSGTSPPSQLEIAQTIASTAITTALAFKELYVDVSTAVFNGTPINTNTLVKNIFDSNPLSTIVNDLKAPGAFKGIALLNNVGKVLGVTGAISSFTTLAADYQADGKVDMINVVDLAINVGSLAIKSNIVGLAVSGGWILIKGELERSN